MTRINRQDIQIVSRHSNMSEDAVQQILDESVYNDATSWQKFLKLFFMGLGVGFMVAGVVFFFAYNWADLNKFIKMGLVQGLIVVVTGIVLFSKLKLDIKNTLLTGAAVLVGVLYAVFGQVYQTGANAYDFFLGWTLSVTLWVFISNFPPLWLIFITLIHTTLFLYEEQVAYAMPDVMLYMIVFLINAFFLVAFKLGPTRLPAIKAPGWFTNVLALGTIISSTMGIVNGIFQAYSGLFLVFAMIVLLLYGVGIKHGMKIRSGFYISIVAFSMIIIVSAFLFKFSHGAVMFLLVSLFVVGSVTLVIKKLISLQKKWSDA